MTQTQRIGRLQRALDQAKRDGNEQAIRIAERNLDRELWRGIGTN